MSARRRRATTTLLLAALTGVPPAASAQSVRGTVLDLPTGSPLPGAAVVLSHGDGTILFTGYADSTGVFTVSLPAPGPYMLDVGQLGYAPARGLRFEVADTDPVELSVALPPNPISLPSVDVTVDAAPARVRTAPTSSARLNRAQIEALVPGAPMSTLLRILPSASLSVYEYPSAPGSSIYHLCVENSRVRTPESMGCRWPAVILDGVPVFQPEEALRFMMASDIASVEFIPSSVAGARWGIGSQNGVLIINTVH